jgi:hypothetical protein
LIGHDLVDQQAMVVEVTRQHDAAFDGRGDHIRQCLRRKFGPWEH